MFIVFLIIKVHFYGIDYVASIENKNFHVDFTLSKSHAIFNGATVMKKLLNTMNIFFGKP